MHKGHIRSDTVAPFFAVLLAAAVLIYVLFIPPIVGVADNGAYSSVIYSEGLYDLDQNRDSLENGYFITDYGVMQYFNEYGDSPHTAQSLFIQAAIGLNNCLSKNDSVFDLRFLGIILSLYFLTALYLFTTAISEKLSIVGALFAALICVFVFCDISYIAYLHSFYAEPVAFISLMLFSACALLFADARGSAGLLLAGLLFSGAVFMFLNNETAPLGIGLGIICLVLTTKKHKPSARIAAVIAGVILICFSTFSIVWFNSVKDRADQYHAMTRGVLIASDDPGSTLESLNIDPQYELLDESTYYDAYPIISPSDPRLNAQFYSQYDTLTIVRFYIENPGAFLGLLKSAAVNMFDSRPDYSNFSASSGYPSGTLARFPSFFSAFKTNSMPHTLGFLILWVAASVASMLKSRSKMAVVLVLIFIGFAAIILPILRSGDAAFTRFMFLFNVIFDIVTVILISRVIALIDPKHRRGGTDR